MNISDFTTVDYGYIFHELSQEEGVRLTSYSDTLNNPTIGIGHLLPPHGLPIDHIIGRKFNGNITNEECELIFRQDLLRTLKALSDGLYPFKQFPDNVQYILTSLCFNLGYSGLSHFPKFLAALKAKDYDTAYKELKNSRWFSQVGNRGVKLCNLLLAH